MHHLEGGFHLDDGEEYIALDPDREAFNARIWQEIKPDKRVSIVVGSKYNIPIQANSVDEVVMLGSTSDDSSEMAEIDRVLKNGGIVKLGALADALPWLESTTCQQLHVMGYERVGTKEHMYDDGTFQPEFIMTKTPDDPLAIAKAFPNLEAGKSNIASYTLVTYKKP